MPEEITFESLPKGEQARVRHEMQAAILAELKEGSLVDLTELRDSVRAELSAQYKAEYAEMVAKQKREAHIADFAAGITGGNGAVRGLPVEAAELVGVLGQMADPVREKWESILERVVESGLVEFEEAGHSKTLRGKQLDPVVKGMLQAAVAQGVTPKAFFEAAGESLGDMAQYDLSEFEEA